MNAELVEQLRRTQQTLEPRAKALRSAAGALKQALKLAGEDKPDALPMQKALIKLQEAAEAVDDDTLQEATGHFQAETEKALGALAFEFAKDLREAFTARGLEVTGRPPTLAVSELVLGIDTAVRKAGWFYGKEALTRPLPLSLSAVVGAFEREQRTILARELDTDAFLGELYTTWAQVLGEKSRRPQGGRVNLLETYSKLVLNRQSGRFWNAPSRSTFRDYPRALFVRDLVLAQPSPTVTINGERQRLFLGVATKSQAESSSRSLWVPQGAFEGGYYADITFEPV